MILQLCSLLLLLTYVAPQTVVEEEDLLVPKPVMDFIMDCRRGRKQDDLVPVLRTEIDVNGETTSQKVSLLGVDELQASLKSAIESDAVTDHIVNRIRDEFTPSGPSFRTENCPPTYQTINITVPPQELVAYHQRLERVMQQNNNILIGQMNDIITAKFASVQRVLAGIVKTRTKVINDNILKLSKQIADSTSKPPQFETFESIVRSSPDQTEVEKATETQILPKDSAASGEHKPNILKEIVQVIKEGYEEEQAIKKTSPADVTEPSTTTVAMETSEEPANGVGLKQEREETQSSLTKLLEGATLKFSDHRPGITLDMPKAPLRYRSSYH